ncbi:MAG: type II toxin-antitoxin system VapC family toxin [Chloracidobacterium sp.]|nr:type II toxin-antitoxin system VapC family toxin [Chloracidobacterium sp.]
MNYLLDTCLLSEFMKPQGNRGVINWFKAQDDETLYISVLAIGEIRKGIKKLGATKRSDELRTWLDSVVFRFDSRILAFDISMANRWGDLIANLESKGRPMPVIDSLMAATALEHNLTIVTRNEDDFEPPGAKVLNLWQ